MTQVVVVMPTYNESQSIGDFLEEIAGAFTDIDTKFIVVNDHSSDETVTLLEEKKKYLPLTIINQEINRGHGPSTIRALKEGLSCSADIIISTDSDGHISGLTLRSLADLLILEDVPYVEVVRRERREEWFRYLVSFSTRLLVWSKCGQLPSDANTPYRAYRKELLEKVMPRITSEFPIPNILISTILRKDKCEIREVSLDVSLIRGKSSKSVTWNQSLKYLPSKKFIVFCFQATKEWFKVK